jgi:hypothetical protein
MVIQEQVLLEVSRLQRFAYYREEGEDRRLSEDRRSVERLTEDRRDC